ncbi:hypothetical protein Q8F55_001332 [Vanrija albida]|uniref:Uncharacterized protein n=1 Tax=Vanrija albida TaxID=181172 RepID=A0ABR3QFR0_9TREE
MAPSPLDKLDKLAKKLPGSGRSSSTGQHPDPVNDVVDVNIGPRFQLEQGLSPTSAFPIKPQARLMQ